MHAIIRALILATLFAALPGPAAAQDISGTWKAAVELDAGSGRAARHVRLQAGGPSQITGTYTGTFGGADLTGTAPQEVRRREMGRRPMLCVIVPERLRRSADEGAPRRRAKQIARFGLEGPPGPPPSPMRADRSSLRASFPACYAAIRACRRLVFNRHGRHDRVLFRRADGRYGHLHRDHRRRHDGGHLRLRTARGGHVGSGAGRVV